MKKRIRFTLQKEYVAKIIIEVFSVVFAVLLALGLNEWRKARADKALGTKAMSNIIAEINENKESLEAILPKHDTIFLEINRAVEALENNNDSTGVSIDNLTMELLTSTAWEATKATEVINLIDIKYMIEISGLYDAQELYMNIVNEFVNDPIFFNQVNPDDKEIIYKLQMYFTRLTSLGHQLSAMYNEKLEILHKAD